MFNFGNGKVQKDLVILLCIYEKASLVKDIIELVEFFIHRLF